jgi:hypothetical protein
MFFAPYFNKTISFISLGHEPNSRAQRRCWQRVVAIFCSFATVEGFSNDLAITRKSSVQVRKEKKEEGKRDIYVNAWLN